MDHGRGRSSTAGSPVIPTTVSGDRGAEKRQGRAQKRMQRHAGLNPFFKGEKHARPVLRECAATISSSPRASRGKKGVGERPKKKKFLDIKLRRDHPGRKDEKPGKSRKKGPKRRRWRWDGDHTRNEKEISLEQSRRARRFYQREYQKGKKTERTRPSQKVRGIYCGLKKSHAQRRRNARTLEKKKPHRREGKSERKGKAPLGHM